LKTSITYGSFQEKANKSGFLYQGCKISADTGFKPVDTSQHSFPLFPGKSGSQSSPAF
jgi:hypothetical protein